MVGKEKNYIEALPCALSSVVRRCLVASLCKITKDIICFLYLAFQDLGNCSLVYKTFVAHIGSEHKGLI